MTDNINQILYKIQQELKVPKAQYNKFGDYNYRSLEDIVEAVKPLLPEGVYLKLSDDIVAVGQDNYIKATVTLTNGKESEFATGIAREGVERKKMQPEQLSGSASSYARKYACNGLFALDDTKDADTDEQNKERQAAETRLKKENAEKATKIFDTHNTKLMGFESSEGAEFKTWWADKKKEREELNKLDTHKALTLVSNMKIKCGEFEKATDKVRGV